MDKERTLEDPNGVSLTQLFVDYLSESRNLVCRNFLLNACADIHNQPYLGDVMKHLGREIIGRSLTARSVHRGLEASHNPDNGTFDRYETREFQQHPVVYSLNPMVSRFFIYVFCSITD